MKADHMTTRAGSSTYGSRRVALTLALPLILLAAGAAKAQADPTLDEVYQAAQSGRLEQARQMMQPVLRDHPNSAKAHFVEAELLARQGQTGPARNEFAIAERLAPGLPFARADSVQGLRRALDGTAAQTRGYPQAPAGHTSGLAGSIPWRALLAMLGGGLAAWLLMRLGRPQGAPVAQSQVGYPTSSGGPVWTSQGAMQAPPASSGLGQQVVGGLATGLAVGAGVMAAEAIGHRLFAANPGFGTTGPAPDALFDGQADPRRSPPDLGGNDFGVDDPGSWDEAGASSGGWDN